MKQLGKNYMLNPVEKARLCLGQNYSEGLKKMMGVELGWVIPE